MKKVLFMAFVLPGLGLNIVNAQSPTKKKPVSIEEPLFVYIDGQVSADGRWLLVSGESGDEVDNRTWVEIQCWHDINSCFEASAQTKGRTLLLRYKVLEWDSNGIIAENSSPICLITRLLVNFQDKSVMAVDMPKKGAKGLPLSDGNDACLLINHTRTYKLAIYE